MTPILILGIWLPACAFVIYCVRCESKADQTKLNMERARRQAAERELAERDEENQRLRARLVVFARENQSLRERAR